MRSFSKKLASFIFSFIGCVFVILIILKVFTAFTGINLEKSDNNWLVIVFLFLLLVLPTVGGICGVKLYIRESEKLKKT